VTVVAGSGVALAQTKEIPFAESRLLVGLAEFKPQTPPVREIINDSPHGRSITQSAVYANQGKRLDIVLGFGSGSVGYLDTNSASSTVRNIIAAQAKQGRTLVSGDTGRIPGGLGNYTYHYFSEPGLQECVVLHTMFDRLDLLYSNALNVYLCQRDKPTLEEMKTIVLGVGVKNKYAPPPIAALSTPTPVAPSAPTTTTPAPTAPPAATTSATTSGARSADVERRLDELKRLRERGLVTEQEAEQKRREILKDL